MRTHAGRSSRFQAVFISERGQTDRQRDKQTDRRDWTPYSTPADIHSWYVWADSL